MDRRKFLKDASAAATAAVFGGVAGCSDGTNMPPAPATITPPIPVPPPTVSHPDLLASYWTIAGNVSPATGGREWSLFDFRDRVEAIARVGFKGMGLWHADIEHTLETYSLADMRRIFDDNGIEHVEVEFLQIGGFFTGGDAASAAEAEKVKLLSWAEGLGARHVKVGDFFGTQTTLDQASEVFANVCADAANVGTNVLFEMMPFAMIDDFDRSIEMCVNAGAPNGGVMMDTWHMFKMGVPLDKIANMPVEYLKGIELNDGWKETPEGLTLIDETVQQRQFPGEGEWDMPGFMEACIATGYDGPYGVEVINTDNLTRSLDELVAKAYTTTAAMFA